MKTKEELNELKIEYESLSRKFAELTEGELELRSAVIPASLLFCFKKPTFR